VGGLVSLLAPPFASAPGALFAPPFASAPGVLDSAAFYLVLLCYWVPYWSRARTLARGGRPVPRWRQWCFAAGLLVLVVAFSPQLGKLSDQLLVAHMVEHLLIGDVAALLIVLGLTGPVLAPLLRIGWVSRLRVLAHPLVALPLWALNFYIWHLAVLYQAALRHGGIHALQHATFLFFGIAMWMALLGPLPKPAWFGNVAKLGYIVAVRLLGTVLGNVFLWSTTVFYPYYIRGDAHWHISAIEDQNLAGAVMMIEESLLTIGLLCWLFLRAAAEGDERQELLDLARVRGVELSEERAARAVSAGRGAELRERLVTDSRRESVK
jgi:cytochrome c oxidase assembly factor CtaG